jgi:hypothetical protein
MLKAIGNAEEAHSSLQLPVVCLALLIESFELDDALLGIGKLLSVVGCSLAYSGGKPKGCGANGGIERWIEGKDGLSRCRRDRWVFGPDKVDEAHKLRERAILFIVSDEGEWEGGSCWRRRDLLGGDAFSRFWGRRDAGGVWRCLAFFIGGVRAVRHLSVSRAVAILAKALVFEGGCVGGVVERGEWEDEGVVSNEGTVMG